MALRIYAIGLVQFVIVAVVMKLDHEARDAARRSALAEQRAADRRPAPPWEGQARFVAGGLARVVDDPRALREELERIANAFGWSVAVEAPDGRVVAQAEPADRARPPIDGVPRESLPVVMHDGREARFVYSPHLRVPGGPMNRSPGSLPVPPDGPLGVPGGPPAGVPFGPFGPFGPPFGPPGPPPFGLAVAVILVVVGVSSWLTARSFARPLASLSTTTRAFGKGELAARAGMKRDDEIGEVARAFDDMADRIAKLLLAERELLANVSHELRTPLARIRVALDLASEADPRTAVESFAEIAQDLAELERIVEDVLASARLALDAGPRSGGATTLPVRTERVDSHALLDRSIARFRAAHPDRTLHAELPSVLPAIDADPVLVRRVVDNLLDNAHEYSDRSNATITLRARHENGPSEALVIEVEDEGVGISAEDQARLFEPFFRVDRSRTRATGGLGLGLVLARRVAEAHGGELTITSELGKGTCARVRLPVAPSSSA
jgi:two-component system, OmpR family, sensor kinase